MLGQGGIKNLSATRLPSLSHRSTIVDSKQLLLSKRAIWEGQLKHGGQSLELHVYTAQQWKHVAFARSESAFARSECACEVCKAGRALPRSLSLLASLLFVVFFVMKLAKLLQVHCITNLLHHHYFWSFVARHYGFGYMAIFLINAGLFDTAASERVTVHRMAVACGRTPSEKGLLPA